ncbi:MAG: amidase domain-containing protein [Clostridia bacterium]|nr:amidase domain-containing protein [Clostridia bacterium]
MSLIPYDRERAVDYARRWAFDRNPRFYDFSEIGGDCTNFVSQCLFAGSAVMNFTPVFGWYYLSASNRTASWTGVEYLYNFLTTNEGDGPFGHVVGEDEAEAGDIIQLGNADGDFYHTVLITSVYPEILVAAHSYDAFDRPFDSYDYDVARFIHIDGVRREE